MSEELLKARSEAVFEIQAALFKASGDAMSRHGNDPHAQAILGAAIAMYVNRIDRLLLPGFQHKMVQLLSLPGDVGGPST